MQRGVIGRQYAALDDCTRFISPTSALPLPHHFLTPSEGLWVGGEVTKAGWMSCTTGVSCFVFVNLLLLLRVMRLSSDGGWGVGVGDTNPFECCSNCKDQNDQQSCSPPCSCPSTAAEHSGGSGGICTDFHG